MDMQMPNDAHAEIREEVRKLCNRFPGEYWRELDARRGYPTEFVQALTEAGWLSALIPRNMAGRACRCPPPRRSLRKSTPPAATPPRAMPRCTRWAPC